MFVGAWTQALFHLPPLQVMTRQVVNDCDHNSLTFLVRNEPFDSFFIKLDYVVDYHGNVIADDNIVTLEQVPGTEQS